MRLITPFVVIYLSLAGNLGRLDFNVNKSPETDYEISSKLKDW